MPACAATTANEQLASLVAQPRGGDQVVYAIEGIWWPQLAMSQPVDHFWVCYLAVPPRQLDKVPTIIITLTDQQPPAVSKDRPVTAFMEDGREVVLFRPRNHAAQQLAGPAAAAEAGSSLDTPAGPRVVSCLSVWHAATSQARRVYC